MNLPLCFLALALIVCVSDVIASDDLVLTDGALEAAQYVGVQIINELMSTIRGFKATRKFHQGGLDGTVNLHDVNVKLTRVPDVSAQLKAASKLNLELENLDAAMDGKFVGSAGWFSASGTVHGDMKGMKVVMKTIIERMPDGNLKVKMDKCRTVVGSSKFTINAQGMFGPLAKNFEGPLNKEISVRLPHLMCEGMKQIVEVRGPKLFARMLKAPLDKAFKKSEKTETLLKKLKQ